MIENIMDKFGIGIRENCEKFVAVVQELTKKDRQTTIAILADIRLPLQFNPNDPLPGTMDSPKLFGMLDCETDTWMGYDDGPLTYDNFEYLVYRARLLEAQLRWPASRIKVQFFTSATRKRDDVTIMYSVEEAMDRLQQGFII